MQPSPECQSKRRVWKLKKKKNNQIFSYCVMCFSAFPVTNVHLYQKFDQDQLQNRAHQFPFHIMMVSVFNMINVNEGNPRLPLKLTTCAEKGFNWITAGRFLHPRWGGGWLFRHCLHRRNRTRFLSAGPGHMMFCENGNSRCGLKKGQSL